MKPKGLYTIQINNNGIISNYKNNTAMNKLLISILLSAIVLSSISCKKQKQERLSGTWVQEYKEGNIEGFKLPEFLDVNFDCNSFRFRQIFYDDVFFPSCNCYYQEDWISGTYKIDKNMLILTGYFEDSIYKNPDSIFYYNTTFKFSVTNNKLILVSPDQNINFENRIVFTKKEEIDCN